MRQALLLLSLLMWAPRLSASQTLETETARLLPAHWWKIGNAFEFQASGEGTEAAMPFAVEYGISDNLELLVEPVPYTAIRPKVGRRAIGVGDIEATLTARVRQESRRGPALAFAAEVKLPTARDTLIGSGEPDYTAYVIASKRFGRIDTHVNVAYTLVGRQDNVQLNNIVSFAVAGVYRRNATARTRLFAEVLGNTAAVPGSESTPTGAPEVAGGELVGTLGAGRDIGSGVLLYFAISYDNNSAVLVRPGITWKFR